MNYLTYILSLMFDCSVVALKRSAILIKQNYKNEQGRPSKVSPAARFTVGNTK